MNINYDHEKFVKDAREGQTILEISLENGISHIHACGGRAKCSTCRVIVLEGLSHLGPRTNEEMKLAEIKGLEENIRLACQTKVYGDISVRRLVIDNEDIEEAVHEVGETTGREEKLCILFSDIRGYTSFAEKFLPYDTIHILNRYFKKMGERVLAYNGYIDKYMGDGLMVIFGLNKTKSKNPGLDAVACALDMLKEMKGINQYMKVNFDTELEIGIGIHYGNAIVGKIGHPAKMQFTAIGDTVNFASRIESANKEAGTNILISDDLKELVKERVTLGKTFITQLKGKEGNYILHEVIGLQMEISQSEKLRYFLFENWNITDAPSLLRLGFHEACTYDPETQQGGFQGRLFAEQNQRWNEELLQISEKVKSLRSKFEKETGSFVSISDFLAHSIAIGLEKSGGPVLELGYGRKDSSEDLQKFRLPLEKDSLSFLLDYFQKMGFSKREFVALSGAHTLGMANGKPFTEEPFVFDNSYFKNLLSQISVRKEESGLLASDFLLLEDPETRNFVAKYAKDEKLFFRDFKQALEKLLHLGQKEWNLEWA
jgi:adenylate cyclase